MELKGSQSSWSDKPLSGAREDKNWAGEDKDWVCYSISVPLLFCLHGHSVCLCVLQTTMKLKCFCQHRSKLHSFSQTN